MRHPVDPMLREVAFVAYHFHWSRDEILEMNHFERRRWVAEISRINEEMDGTGDR